MYRLLQRKTISGRLPLRILGLDFVLSGRGKASAAANAVKNKVAALFATKEATMCRVLRSCPR